MRLTPELVRIHAHACGDGWLYGRVRKRSQWDIQKYNRNIKFCKEWNIGYSNKESQLLNEFKNDIRKLLPKSFIEEREDEIRVRSKILFNDLKSLGANSSRLWVISNKIFNLAKENKINWIRSFFDDESTIEKSNDHNRIRIKLVNLKGLNQVKVLLNSLKLKSSLTGPNCDNTWYLTISGIENIVDFYKIIKLKHPSKRRKIEKIIKAYAPSGI